MNRFSGRPSPAMAVAFIALLAALSGTAVALPGRNTVDSGDIKRGAVKRSDIGRNAVNAGKVSNGSLRGADVRNDSLTGADLDESTLGQVPSANTANSANTATTATNADNAGALGGTPAGSYSPSAAGVTTIFMVDGANLENGVGPLPTFDSNVAGTDTFTFPYNVNDGTHNLLVTGGGAGATGGTVPCIHSADPVDADTILIESLDAGGAACSEEYTVLVF